MRQEEAEVPRNRVVKMFHAQVINLGLVQICSLRSTHAEPGF